MEVFKTIICSRHVPVFKVNGPSLLSVFNDPEEDVGVNGSLVGLVQNHPTVAGQKRVCKKMKTLLDPGWNQSQRSLSNFRVTFVVRKKEYHH